MSESYFFALSPRFLKVEHNFAKNIKPNTKYRLVVYKGIQKCDQMKEGIKSKLVGGKIQLQTSQLLFNIPYYNPTKNIQFTIKLYEEKPNQQQSQVASYVIGSSDYIKSYKGQKLNSFQISGQLQPDLSLQFDLFVEKSKQLLNDLIQKSSTNNQKSAKQLPEDIKSQSGQSKQIIRQGQGFLSPRKRIQRKKGHQGKLRSRSRSKSQQKGQTLVSSKIETGKSIPKSINSGKSVGKVDDKKSPEVNQKIYQYQPVNRMKYTDTKQIFDIQIQRSNSPIKSPKNTQDNVNKQKSPQQNRTNFTSPQNNALTNSQSKANASSKVNIPVTFPKNSASNIEGMEIKHTTNVFDIVPRNNVTSPTASQPKSPGKYQPARSPRIATYQTVDNQQLAASKSSKSLNESKSKLGANLKNLGSVENMKESKINITVQGAVNEPKAVIVNSEQNEDIVVKAKPLTKVKDSVHQSSTLKGSLRLSQAVHTKQHEDEVKIAEKAYQQKKNQILYGLFLVVSIFLIYNAMLPTRRV